MKHLGKLLITMGMYIVGLSISRHFELGLTWTFFVGWILGTMALFLNIWGSDNGLF